MKNALLAAIAALLLLGSPAVAAKQNEPIPASVEIEYGAHVFTVPGDQPLVSCIVGQRADLDGRFVTLATFVRNVRGAYDLVSEKETRQTGPTESYGVGTCLFLEGAE
jgi:hypothetical protein